MLITEMICPPAPQGHEILVFRRYKHVELNLIDVLTSIQRNNTSTPASHATSSKPGVSKYFCEKNR